MDMLPCRFRICRVGLWVIVKGGCVGAIHRDEINSDPKVWFEECLHCARSSGDVGRDIENVPQSE